jgi:CDP-diacylglycerol--glycerol-3-phosphate 3-phosphatidyltransferase
LYYHNYEYAIFSFVILAITDFIDGKIARKWKMETKTGAILDPVVDKVAVILNLGALCFVNIRIIVPTIGITIREVYVALILASARKQKETVATVYGGKVKMWAQCIAVILQYIALMLMGFWQKIAVDALWFAFGMTVSTGIEYFKKNRQRQ